MTGVSENILKRAVLDDMAGVNNRNLVADLGDDAEVMCDHPHGCIIFLTKALHHLKNLCLNRHVKSSRRLVGDQKLRVARESHCDNDTLVHAAGERMRIFAAAAAGNTD